MDFIDYDTYNDNEYSASNNNNNSVLPEPVARLNLNPLSLNPTKQFKDLNLAGILGQIDSENVVEEEAEEELNLHDKMAKYAELSMKELNINLKNTDNSSVQLPSYVSVVSTDTLDISKIVSQKPSQNLETTNVALNRKLSKILNDYSMSNYQSTSNLRKSLQTLENNKSILSLDENKINNPGYIGTLARKSLKNNVETELLKEHLTVLEEFKPIVTRIKALSKSIEQIQELGAMVMTESSKTHANPKHSKLEEINELYETLNNLKLKKQIMMAIKNQYTLTQVDEDVIENGYVNDELFSVINRVMSIKEKTMYLLGLPNNKPGESLISEVNGYLERLNKKLFNFLIDFLYSFESSPNSMNEKLYGDNKDSLLLFQKSLIYLSNELEYFNEFFKRVSTMRAKSVLDQFLSQFDFNSSDANPMLLSSNDPIRYIGDILANVYSLIANEADFVKSLFSFQETQFEGAPISFLQKNDEYLSGLDDKLLNDIVQTLSNTCRIRIGQVIKFEENPIILYEIIQLISLYEMMFERKEIKSNNSLIVNLLTLSSSAQEKIIEHFQNYNKEIKSMEYKITDDLLPPEWVSDYLKKLSGLFYIYERNYNVDEKTAEKQSLITADFLNNIIKVPFGTMLSEQLKNAFPQAKRKDIDSSLLYTVQINCFDLIKTKLQPYSKSIFTMDDNTSEIYKWIDKRYDESIYNMLQLQIKLLFEKTGLGMYNNLLNMIFPVSSIQDELDYDMYLSLTDNPLMALDKVNENVHSKLNDYAPMALTELQGLLLFKLTSPTIADNICQTCFSQLSKFYITFKQVLLHLYPDDSETISAILNFSEEEFNTLIGI